MWPKDLHFNKILMQVAPTVHFLKSIAFLGILPAITNNRSNVIESIFANRDH